VAVPCNADARVCPYLRIRLTDIVPDTLTCIKRYYYRDTTGKNIRTSEPSEISFAPEESFVLDLHFAKYLAEVICCLASVVGERTVT